jgi:hypothetical protein
VAYVGKASGRPNLVDRHLEHFIASIGCLYRIPAWARRSGLAWECFPQRPECASVLFSKERLLELVAEAFDYITSVDVYLAPFEGALLSILERNLIWTLKPFDNGSGTRTPPTTLMEIDHGEAAWIAQSNVSRVQLHR